MDVYLLIASLVFQTGAAVAAIVLYRRFPVMKGWIYLSAGFVLMILRRGVSLVSGAGASFDVIAETVALLTSAVMLAGVFSIAKSFLDYQTAQKRLRNELREKEEAKRELEEREREYKTLVNNLPGFAYRCENDRNWTMRYLSMGCINVTGYRPEELIDNRVVSYNSVIAPEFRDYIWADWQKKLKKNAFFEDEYQIITKDGTRKWVWEKGCGVFSRSGELISIEGFISDVTERRKAEEELQRVEKLASVGTLAGGIAHDFNNIMTGVFGNISMALEHLPEEGAGREYIARAEDSIRRATNLTKQLLTFARGGEPRMKKVDIRKLVESTVAFDLSGSSVEVSYKWDRGLWSAEADRSQLEQVFSNLTVNACQAMPDGGVLEITGSNYSSFEVHNLDINPGNYVKLSFRDHGCGIRNCDLDRIFDPYFTTKPGGSGLGLATVYSVIRRHGGRITVESFPGTGTEFILLIPAISSPNGDELSRKNRDYGRDLSCSVLVMDDEETVRDVAESMLKHLGCSVVTTSDGKEAVEVYRQAFNEGKPFDVLIIDLTVPGGMGGEEAMAEILNTDPSAKAVVSSGYSDSPVMANFRNHGFSGVMEKPYTLEKLKKTITELLES